MEDFDIEVQKFSIEKEKIEQTALKVHEESEFCSHKQHWK